MVLPASHPAVAPDPALLARADWRFLLPAPPEGGLRHLVLLGGPEGLADLLLAAGFARRVSRSLAGPGTADAVAVLAGPGPAPPFPAGEAARCLAPGGVLYCEFRAGARPRLPAGVAATGLYAVWPRFAGARAWVPLDLPGALPWFLDTVYPASTPRKWGVAQLLATLPDPRRACRLLTRCFALTASAGPQRGMPLHRLAFTPGEASPQAAGESPAVIPSAAAAGRPGERAPLLLSHGHERVVLLPFDDRSPGAGGVPRAALKVPRLPRFNQVGEEEQTVLGRIRAGLPAAVAAALPRPEGVLRAGGLAVAVESFAPGRTLLRSTGAWGASARGRERDLELAASWLADFHQAGELARGPWPDRETQAWVDAPLDAYRRRFGASAAEGRLFALTLERAASLAGVPVPTVWQHRDFTPWNLLRHGRRLSVIDWEGARPGPPLCDLLHFATLWHQLARGLFEGKERLPARLAAFRELFLEGGQDRYAQDARQALAGYCRRLGLDARLVPVLLVATWAELAVRRAGPAGGEREARETAPEAAYVAVLAAGADALFNGGGLP